MVDPEVKLDTPHGTLLAARDDLSARHCVEPVHSRRLSPVADVAGIISGDFRAAHTVPEYEHATECQSTGGKMRRTVPRDKQEQFLQNTAREAGQIRFVVELVTEKIVDNDRSAGKTVPA